MSETQEIRICGWNAAMVRFAQQPASIIRAYVSAGRVGPASKLLKYMASQRLTYHVVEEDVLAKVSGSVHHEGIVLVARQAKIQGMTAFVGKLKEHEARIGEREARVGELESRTGDAADTVASRTRPPCLLVLDGVVNPHNLGAIARVAAHFGAMGILVLRDKADPAGGGTRDVLTPSGYRIAAGGAETLIIAQENRDRAPELFQGLRGLGYDIVGTTSHAGTPSLYDAKFGGKVAFVLGSESTGLSREVTQAISRFVAIPGSGAVESLNVACAASTILGERWRRISAQSQNLH
jgi:TrmH RNA methyltransferase